MFSFHSWQDISLLDTIFGNINGILKEISTFLVSFPQSIPGLKFKANVGCVIKGTIRN